MNPDDRVPLSYLADVVRGVSYGAGEAATEPRPGYVPLLRAGNIGDELNVSTELVWVPRERISRNQELQVGDIVMCTSSGSSDVVGKTAALAEQWRGSFGAFCAVIRPRPSRADPRFLLHYLRSARFRAWTRQSSGANIKNIRKSELEDFCITLVELDEQRRIAGILDKADAIRRKRQQAIKLTDDFLRSVFLDMFGDTTVNPNRWEKVAIREVATEVSYGTSAKAGTVGRYPILRMSNITYRGRWDLTDLKYIDLDPVDLEKYLVRKNDILFNRTNSRELVGKTAVYRESTEMAYAGYLVRLRLSSEAEPEYVAAYLNSAHGKTTLMSMCKSIIGMANINAQELLGIPILSPPITLQREFSRIVTATLAAESRLQEASRQADQLFGALAVEAFTGRL